jgi:pyochelin synthetase
MRLGVEMEAQGGDIKLKGALEHLSVELLSQISLHKIDLLLKLESQKMDHKAVSAFDCDQFPLTEMQRAYYLGRGNVYELGGVSSHVYHEFECCGVDALRLESAFHAVIARQSALRLCIESDEAQRIASIDSIRRPLIELHDFRSLSDQYLTDSLYAIRQRMSHQVVDARAPLVPHVHLALLAENRQILFVSHDGLAVDGLSMQMLFAQWQQAYEAGPQTLIPLAVDFSQYVAAAQRQQDGPWHQRARDYWLKRIEEGSLPGVPQLPLACSPKQIDSVRVARHSARLDAAQYTALKVQIAKHGLTATAVILAAYLMVLRRWSTQEHFSLTVTVADRIPFDPDVMQMIGNFTTSALFVAEPITGRAFRAYAKAALKQLQEVADHRQFSSTEVLREIGRQSGRTLLQPFTFNSAIDYPGVSPANDSHSLFLQRRFGVSQTPQVWLNAFVIAESGGVEVQLDAVCDLFPEQVIESIAVSLQGILCQLAELDHAWYTDLSDFALPQHQQQNRLAANDTESRFNAAPAWAGFINQAGLRPAATALIDPVSGSWSYASLHEKAGLIAEWLTQNMGKNNNAVAINMGKSGKQIAAVLGVQLSGRAYMPLEDAWPHQRIARALCAAGVSYVLTTEEGDTSLLKRVACFDGLVLSTFTSYVASCDSAKKFTPAFSSPDWRSQMDASAYMICTSGTTGDPKIVEISHRSLSNLIDDCLQRFHLDSDTVVLASSSLAFDLSVFDIFCTLSAGGCIVLPAADQAKDIDHWIDLAKAYRVTLWNAVPQVFFEVAGRLQESKSTLDTLTKVLMSGDRILPSLPVLLGCVAPFAELHALGGPTETTVWNIHCPLADWVSGLERIPYGKPTSNNRYYVLDCDGNPTPDWVVGQLHAAGVGLATGYVGTDAPSEKRFIYNARLQERLYATGDMGRYLPDGCIDILGRADFQIKVNGYRIETGEIEHALLAEPDLRDCVVLAIEGDAGQVLLAAALVTNLPPCQRSDLVARLRDRAALSLPSYSQPHAFHCVDEPPLSFNGKVDRAALHAEVSQALKDGKLLGARDVGPQPETEIQIAIARIWAAVLGHEPAGIDGDFAAEGGDSLLAARVALAIRRKWNVVIKLEMLLQLNSIRNIAAHIETASLPN